MLAIGLPEVRSLGTGSRFAGYVCANHASGGWQGDLVGQLLGIDLGALVSEQFPHKLSGAAKLTVQHARFLRGRLEEAKGSLVAGPGVIGRSLVEAAVTYLGLARCRRRNCRATRCPTSNWRLEFSVDSRGLTLRGRGGEPGAILADRRGGILGEPVRQPLPVVALIQTLVPASENHVPATRQTDWLARHLPVADVLPPPAGSSFFPHARLRVGGGAE